MTKKIFFLLICLTGLCSGEKIARTVVAVYNGRQTSDIWETLYHQAAEMPLNHLGINLEYHDIVDGLPDISEREDVIGVLLWLSEDQLLAQDTAEAYLDWSIAVLKSGKKYVIMSYPYFNSEKVVIPKDKLDTFWNLLGLRFAGRWVEDTYEIQLRSPYPNFINFEREYPATLPTFMEMYTLSEDTVSYLSPASDNNMTLIAISPSGAYAANEYAIYYLWEAGKDARQWYINLFEFFRQAFDTDKIPKPDTTTLAGRRIYYSHIDGDGWNNMAQFGDWRNRKKVASEILYEEILTKHPDLPATVGPIGADLDSEWGAREAGQQIAKKILGLPHVEIGCHTFTHPFEWGFFENYSPEHEYPYLHLYGEQTWLGRGPFAWMRVKWLEAMGAEQGPDFKRINEDYEVPRAFALKPFDLELETEGAVKKVESYSPAGKEAALYQWSGDCQPFYGALKAVQDMGLPQINGGITRFDRKFPSYAWVSPIGRQVGDRYQIYASNSNENTYTAYWRDDFFAYNTLPETFKNTETPIRVKPMNLYYHIYSAEKHAGLEALRQNIKYIKSQTFIPVKASEFSKICQGFYSVDIEGLGNDSWKFSRRGALQTIRFDRSSDKQVDFSRSAGVVGQRHYQGSLYVYLDSAAEDPVVALEEQKEQSEYYLIESSWEVSDIRKGENQSLTFHSEGFGVGEFQWRVPKDGEYRVFAGDEEVYSGKSENRIFRFTLDQSGVEGLRITISL